MGLAVYTQVTAEALTAFLARFDVGTLVSAKGIAEGVENTNYLVDTTAGRYILTLYEKRVAADDLPFFLALLDHLAERGLPVPRRSRTTAASRSTSWPGVRRVLIRFLPGVSLTHPNVAQARAAGAALGQMHAALADFPLERENAMGFESWKPLLERCGAGLGRAPARPAS